MADREEIERRRRRERERRRQQQQDLQRQKQEGLSLLGPTPLVAPALPSLSTAAAPAATPKQESTPWRSSSQEKARPSSNGGSGRKKPRSRSARAEGPMSIPSNKLLTELRLKNDLPTFGAEMKLVPIPLPLERFVPYKLCSLEQACTPDILMEAYDAAPIEVVNPTAYDGENPGIDAIDRQLLKASVGPSHHKAKRHHNVSWMRKTEYISAESGAEKLYTRKISSGVGAQTAVNAAPDVSMSIDEQLEVIERTFVDANTPLEELVHPTKAGVTAVKQWHLYPDFALWENEYCQVSFTDDPTPPPAAWENEDEINGEDLCNGGLVHALSTNDGEQYAVFAVPCINHEMFEDLEAFEEREIDEKEYRLVRPYSMSMLTADGREMFLVFDDERGTASYNIVAKRLELKKRHRGDDSWIRENPGRLGMRRIERENFETLEVRRSQLKKETEEELSNRMAT